MLSATRKQFFREQGYLRIRGLLEEPLLAAVREAADREAADRELARANDPARRSQWEAPRVGAPFHWHQDGFSWGHSNLVTLMVLLDEATTSNGCLEIVPGIHRGYLANIPSGDLQWTMNEKDDEVRDTIGQ